jgi:hypothetical protein
VLGDVWEDVRRGNEAERSGDGEGGVRVSGGGDSGQLFFLRDDEVTESA